VNPVRRILLQLVVAVVRLVSARLLVPIEMVSVLEPGSLGRKFVDLTANLAVHRVVGSGFG
jgi:hypothetical protein